LIALIFKKNLPYSRQRPPHRKSLFFKVFSPDYQADAPRKPQVSLALALRRASFSSYPSWGLFAPNPPNHHFDDSQIFYWSLWLKAVS